MGSGTTIPGDPGYSLSGICGHETQGPGRADMADSMEANGRERVATAGTLVLGLAQIGLGLWMAAAPRSFFDAIGGVGGPNQHQPPGGSPLFPPPRVAPVLAWRRPP